MERKMKLHKSLRSGSFSIILLCLLCACDPVEEHKEEWSFNNYIGFNIDLRIYFKKGHASEYSNLASGDSVMLFTSVVKDIGGVGAGYFLNTINSVYVMESSSGGIIGIWTEMMTHNHTEGYEDLPDFFDDLAWINAKSMIQHSKNHVQYRYLLDFTDD